ncbi:MAG: bacteriohemerythrin [Sulfuritalea sp.]|jgi:hemerythrin|nr:bacteriohemerythrin [Sulfuritalea sp.]
MKWKNEYSLGIEEIDNQHKGLIDKFSQVEEIVATKGGWMKIHYKVVELGQVARRHFDFEEGLMRLFGIPNVEEHKKGHEYFFTKVAEIESHSLLGSAESELLQFLYEWLRDHILVADRRDYAELVLGLAHVVKAEVGAAAS